MPIVKNFNGGKGGKWSRPLDLDITHIRKHIRLKSKLWKKYMATQANKDFLDYKRQQNILRRLVKKDLMEKQNAIALDYRNTILNVYGTMFKVKPNAVY